MHATKKIAEASREHWFQPYLNREGVSREGRTQCDAHDGFSGSAPLARGNGSAEVCEGPWQCAKALNK